MDSPATPALDIPVVIHRIFGNQDPPNASRDLLKFRKRLLGKRNQLVLVAKTETVENAHGPSDRVSRERAQIFVSLLDEEELDLSIHFCAMSLFRLKRHVRIDTNTDWRPSVSDMPILMEVPDVARLVSGPWDRRVAVCIGNEDVLSWLHRSGFPAFDWPRGDLCRDAIARYELLLAMLTLLRPETPIDQILPDTALSVATKLAGDLSAKRDAREYCRAVIETSGDLHDEGHLLATVRELRQHTADIRHLCERIMACGLTRYSFLRDVLARI